MRSGPRSSCCPTCIGIRISPSSSRPTTAGWSATSSAPPTPTPSRSGSTTSGGPSAARGGRSPSVEQSRQDGTLIYAYARRGGAEPYAEDYPAHLHIDLLPEVQGQGWGRRLDRDARRRAARARRPGTAPRGIRRQRRCARVLPPRRVHSRSRRTTGVQAFGDAISSGDTARRPSRRRARSLARMDDLSAPTGREEALRALPRADGTAPLALVLGGDRLHRRAARAATAQRPATACACSRAIRTGSRRSTGGAASRSSRATRPIRRRSARAVARRRRALLPRPLDVGAARGSRAPTARAAETVAEAAAAASVGRIVYLGGLHPEDVDAVAAPALPRRGGRDPARQRACRRSCCRPAS